MDTLKRFKLTLLILIILIIILLLGSFFLGSKYALDHLTIRNVTPTQIADAMKDDHFWVSYREDTLMLSAKVVSVNHSKGTTIVGFKTESSYGAACSFVNLNKALGVGQTIKVLSVANAAERLKSGVQLNNCVVL